MSTAFRAGIMLPFKRVISWVLRVILPKKVCRHQFDAKCIELTNIPLIPKPESRDYEEWCDYFGKFYEQDGVTKRVKCPCRICGEVFFAHCGLDLPGSLH